MFSEIISLQSKYITKQFEEFTLSINIVPTYLNFQKAYLGTTVL